MASLAIEGNSRGGLPGGGLLDEVSDEDGEGGREDAGAGGDEISTGDEPTTTAELAMEQGVEMTEVAV